LFTTSHLTQQIKISFVQNNDCPAAGQRGFCTTQRVFENILAILIEDANAVVMMSDEAHFHLNGFVNKQNCPFWATKNQ
jgi:hypothetical protein